MRDLVARHAPILAPRVLDLGCGTGRLGEALKLSRTASLMHGIELDPTVAEAARARLDKVWVADLSQFDWTELDRYDVIIAADLLEHLADPWQVLVRLHEVLAPDGRVIPSIPNVRYWKVIANLLLRGSSDTWTKGARSYSSSLLYPKQHHSTLSTTQDTRSNISARSRSTGSGGGSP